MLTEHNTVASGRAQQQTEHRAHRFEPLAARNADIVCNTFRRIYHRSADSDAIRRAAAMSFEDHPFQDASRHHAAVHEAGHFIAYEFEGIVAGYAHVYGPRFFGRGGWGGETQHWGDLPIDPKWGTTKNLLIDARVALAGPLAEALLADGEAFSSIGELMDARLLVARAADMLGIDDDALWTQTLHATVQLIERHTAEINQVAALLMKRSRVTRSQRDTAKILARVGRSSSVKIVPSDRGTRLVRRLVAAKVPNFAEVR